MQSELHKFRDQPVWMDGADATPLHVDGWVDVCVGQSTQVITPHGFTASLPTHPLWPSQAFRPTPQPLRRIKARAAQPRLPETYGKAKGPKVSSLGPDVGAVGVEVEPCYLRAVLRAGVGAWAGAGAVALVSTFGSPFVAAGACAAALATFQASNSVASANPPSIAR